MLTSQGLVQYADVTDAGTDATTTDIYTPPKVAIPASLMAGVIP